MKYLCIAVLLFCYNNLFAQQIDRIGALQIGGTESQVLAELKVDPNEIIEGSAKTMKFIEKNRKEKVIKFVYNPLSPLVTDILDLKLELDATLDRLYIKKCKDAVVYTIPKYNVYGTTLSNIILTFYKGSLIKILIIDNTGENNQFLAVFQSKYGEGSVSSSKLPMDACGNYGTIVSNSWNPKDSSVLVLSVKKSFCVLENNEQKKVNENRFAMQNGELFNSLIECGKVGDNSK